MDQREDVALLARQQLAQMDAALRLTILDELRERPDRGEGPGDLLVQLLPVGDDDEGPVAAEPPQHLLGEHHHREALAAALRVPEDAEAAPVLPICSTASMARLTPST